MNIQINAKVSVNSGKKDKLTRQTIKKSHKGHAGDDGFSFSFNNNMKIKAIVARKRKIPSSSSEQKSHDMASSKIGGSSESDLMASSSSLCLNISRGSKDDEIRAVAKLNQKKMNRNEKKALILNKRAEAYKTSELALKKSKEHSKKSKSQLVQTSRDNVINETKQQQKEIHSLFPSNVSIPTIGSRLVKPINEPLFTGASMSTLEIHPHLVKTLADILQITELTTVQQRAVPVVLSGKDVLVRSQTGSGKTLAYALPIVQKMQEIQPKLSRNDGIHAIIVVTSRELAIQTYELFVKLLKPFTRIVAGVMSGGENRKAEKARIRKGINILVGTPGRLCDHILHTESLKLDTVKWLVLDEADRLYERGYEKDVQKIIAAINGYDRESLKDFDLSSNQKLTMKKDVQSILLSATLSPAVHQLAGLALKDPLYIDTSDTVNEKISIASTMDNCVDDGKIVIPATINQTYILVPPKLRLVTLSGLLAIETKSSKVLIFMATENLVEFHYDLMVETLTKKIIDADDELEVEVSDDSDNDVDNDDYKVDMSKFHRLNKNSENDKPIMPEVKFFKLHGSLTQIERSSVFNEFKRTKNGVLLTTDVAARGLDVPMVDLVVQFSPPLYIVDYAHRVGRTARAGRSGRTVLFLSPNEVDYIKILEEKRIRISQEKYETYLKGVMPSIGIAPRIEESASKLQLKFQQLISDDKEMHEKACKAFLSWTKFFASFPINMRQIFNLKNAHMGHFAKSLGLLEAPKTLAKLRNTEKPQQPNNRLTYRQIVNTKRQNILSGQKRHEEIKKSLWSGMSEYDSGLPLKKRKNM